MAKRIEIVIYIYIDNIASKVPRTGRGGSVFECSPSLDACLPFHPSIFFLFSLFAHLSLSLSTSARGRIVICFDNKRAIDFSVYESQPRSTFRGEPREFALAGSRPIVFKNVAPPPCNAGTRGNGANKALRKYFRFGEKIFASNGGGWGEEGDAESRGGERSTRFPLDDVFEGERAERCKMYKASRGVCACVSAIVFFFPFFLSSRYVSESRGIDKGPSLENRRD